MTETIVSNLTLNDLRDLIRTEIEQTLLELLGDPDAGLELRDDLKQRLQQSASVGCVRRVGLRRNAPELPGDGLVGG